MKLLISQHQLQSRFVIIQSVQDVNHLAFSPDAYCVKLLLNCHTVAVRHVSSHPPSSDIRIVLLRIKDVCETSHNPFLAAAGLRATRASMQRDICKSSFVDARLFFFVFSGGDEGLYAAYSVRASITICRETTSSCLVDDAEAC